MTTFASLKDASPCPNCKRENLYRTKRPISSSGGQGPSLLPHLGRFLIPAELTPVVCQDCGLVRYFTNVDACSKLESSRHWKKIAPSN